MAFTQEIKEALNRIVLAGGGGGRYIGPGLGDLISEAITTDPISVLSGTADPSAGAGIAANPGDIYRRDVAGADGGELWIKEGDADTAWVKVNTSAGDNLGNHTATQNLDLANFNLLNAVDVLALATLSLKSAVPDGAGTVGHIIETANTVYAPGSTLLSVRSNSVERFRVGAGTSNWGVVGTQVELQRQAGGDKVVWQAESGFGGDFSTMSPQNPWGFAMEAAKDLAGFDGSVVSIQLSPNGNQYDAWYSPLGAGEIDLRVWNFADWGYADSVVYRVGADDYRVRHAAFDSSIVRSRIEVYSLDQSSLGIADARLIMEADGSDVIAAGLSGVGIKAALEIDSVKILGPQGAAVADASGGTTVDAEARAAINTLLARLRTHGIIAT